MLVTLHHGSLQLVQHKLHNINPYNTTHSLISRNPKERMPVVQISLLIVTFLSLISQICHVCKPPKKQPTPSHCAMCQYVESHLLILILLFFRCHLLNVGACIYQHRPGRPSGVDHTNGSERRIYSNSIVSRATLIL